ncbi:MAG: DUF302 domain-containing protein [Halioglobus sp.]
MKYRLLSPFFPVALFAAVLAGCGGGEPIPPERYAGTDRLVDQIRENLAAAPNLTEVADIDHSRLAQQAGATMPPARVIIFSDTQLESQLIELNPLTALDLPLRVLAFEDSDAATSKIIYNNFDYLASRYELDPNASSGLRKGYEQSINEAIEGVPASAVAAFSTDEMNPDGIITIESPYGYKETIERVNAAINAQDDTVHFGTVDFQANARDSGIEIAPAHMILFGGPAPGGKAMANAQTLGLDGFCQKFLIWEDSSGRIKLSFNDLLALAERQEAQKSLALRVINYRLNKTFGDALESQ